MQPSHKESGTLKSPWGLFPSHLSPGRTKASVTNPRLGAALWGRKALETGSGQQHGVIPALILQERGERTLWECV